MYMAMKPGSGAYKTLGHDFEMTTVMVIVLVIKISIFDSILSFFGKGRRKKIEEIMNCTAEGGEIHISGRNGKKRVSAIAAVELIDEDTIKLYLSKEVTEIKQVWWDNGELNPNDFAEVIEPIPVLFPLPA